MHQDNFQLRQEYVPIEDGALIRFWVLHKDLTLSAFAVKTFAHNN